MKTLQNNFTIPEQSKRLLELGVPADSADCIWWSDDNFTSGLYDLSIIPYNKIYSNERWVDENGEIVNLQKLPCWSVGRLIEIFDLCYQSFLEEQSIPESWILTQEAKEQFGSYIEYLAQTFETQKNFLDFSKLEE